MSTATLTHRPCEIVLHNGLIDVQWRRTGEAEHRHCIQLTPGKLPADVNELELGLDALPRISIVGELPANQEELVPGSGSLTSIFPLPGQLRVFVSEQYAFLLPVEGLSLKPKKAGQGRWATFWGMMKTASTNWKVCYAPIAIKRMSPLEGRLPQWKTTEVNSKELASIAVGEALDTEYPLTALEEEGVLCNFRDIVLPIATTQGAAWKSFAERYPAIAKTQGLDVLVGSERYWPVLIDFLSGKYLGAITSASPRAVFHEKAAGYFGECWSRDASTIRQIALIGPMLVFLKRDGTFVVDSPVCGPGAVEFTNYEAATNFASGLNAWEERPIYDEDARDYNKPFRLSGPSASLIPDQQASEPTSNSRIANWTQGLISLLPDSAQSAITRFLRSR